MHARGPGFPRTFFSGTTTSSNVTPRVSAHRWPMLISFRPGVTPGVSVLSMRMTDDARLSSHFTSFYDEGSEGFRGFRSRIRVCASQHEVPVCVTGTCFRSESAFYRFETRDSPVIHIFCPLMT